MSDPRQKLQKVCTRSAADPFWYLPYLESRVSPDERHFWRSRKSSEQHEALSDTQEQGQKEETAPALPEGVLGWHCHTFLLVSPLLPPLASCHESDNPLEFWVPATLVLAPK
uniref:Uncharacterized protein n=1 Tax=Malurus cyaneus samueli TaxID=2593467 RepID=A0A8C5UFK0_9PASS